MARQALRRRTLPALVPLPCRAPRQEPPLAKTQRKLHPLPILSNLAALAALAPPGGAKPGLLALDVSKRAIGLAGADAGWRLATALRSIRRTRLAADLERLRDTIEERAAGALVIGLPLNMDGSEGPRCQAIRQFARDLDGALGLPLLLWDERLTTFAAREAAAARAGGGRRRPPDIDALAAELLLQDVLDRLAQAGG